MGNSLLFPKTYSRRESLKRGAKQGLKIIIGLVPIFITAGFLESFVTRKTEWPNLFPKDKPYLLVYENGVKLSKAELELVYLSEKISSFDGFELKVLNPKVIERYLKENSTSNGVAPTKEQATKALMNDYNTLFKTENDSSNSTDIKFWYYLSNGSQGCQS